MSMYIEQENISIQLPVLPESFEFNASQNNPTVSIESLGEISIIGKRNLKTLSIESFYPAQEYDFCDCTPELAPYDFVNQILAMRSSGKPVSFVDTDGKSMKSTIESFSYGESDGTGDLAYSIEFREYRKPTIKKTAAAKPTPTKTKKSKEKTIKSPETSRESKGTKSTTYIVKKGDTLSAIAKSLTGDAANYRAIANQNNIANPNRIYPGQKLVIKI